jgi:LuxR family transcriptional regulator, positive regulator of biofilm formation
MNIGIHFSNHLMAEAIHQLLVKNGYDHVVTSGRSPANGFTPHVLLVDITTLTHDLLARYPEAKVLLMDTGTEPEQLWVGLLSYRIHGVLSPHTELPLFKKALTAVSEGKLWIDNGEVKTLLSDTGDISRKGKIGHITRREQEIIKRIRQGLSNNEIARRLTLSPHTVKTHLNSIFRKLNVTSRSKLMALATERPLASSAG